VALAAFRPWDAEPFRNASSIDMFNGDPIQGECQRERAS
jgi:hypothetical protein